MNIISLDDALLLFDKWKSEDTAVAVFCVNPSFTAFSIDARVEGVSRDFVRFTVHKMELRITLSEVRFVYLESRELGPMEDIPGELANFTFEECLRIVSPKSETFALLFSHIQSAP